MKTALVLGAGGFIGSHMVKRLKKEGYWVRGVDLKHPEFSKTEADDFVIGDLRNRELVEFVIPGHFNQIFQFAADMGGAGYIFSGEHDADVMHNSAQINLNVLDRLQKMKYNGVVFYSSSACMYPQEIQEDTNNLGLKEEYGYPGNPDSEYGWEKLFSERLYAAYARNYGLDIRIARFHNIFGEQGTWQGNKEKAPAAMCRKVAESNEYVEVWGDGLQTRSFLYIDECIEGVRRLMESDYKEPINIGSDEMISINDLAKMVIDISGKSLTIKNVPSNALGVRGRNSDNTLIKEVLSWSPSQPLRVGMEKLYSWVNNQVNGII